MQGIVSDKTSAQIPRIYMTVEQGEAIDTALKAANTERLRHSLPLLTLGEFVLRAADRYAAGIMRAEVGSPNRRGGMTVEERRTETRLAAAIQVRLAPADRRRMIRAMVTDNRDRALRGAPLLRSHSDLIRAAVLAYIDRVEERALGDSILEEIEEGGG